ncbi:hypothetical protein DAMA08_016620 [Martiniozyma asiatica (nom. inval.)]|nr:hypothetical protein DAMA08_016620 [Martiniozyma asiatica]
MSSAITEIKAIGVYGPEDFTSPKAFTYTPQYFRSFDVDIEVECCGICGSDIHTVKGVWGEKPSPTCVGHEIVGKVVAAGPDARFKIGDRVGVGAQADACGNCTRCNNGHSNMCKKFVSTYARYYPETGIASQGGYASHVRTNSKYAFKIPDKMDSKVASVLMCGGITGFRPLMTADVKKGTRVGVSGIGGIGHMTIMFAKALGAEVTAISRNNKKKDMALELGADHYIATDEEGFEDKYMDSLDVIVNTGSSFSEGSTSKILNLLTPFGRMIFITAPPITETLTLSPFQLLMSSLSVGGSAIGSPADIEYMLELAAEHNIQPWIETIDISEEGVKEAWERMEKGDVKFRFVLTGYDKYFGTNPT